MSEWLVEQGIGEDRAILLDKDAIVAARLHWPGGLVAGQVEDARLVAKPKARERGVALFTNGERANVDRLPPDASEGAIMRLEVTRPRIREAGRLKLAQCRPSDSALRPPLRLLDQLLAEGNEARTVHRFPTNADWEGLWQEAMSARVEFSGGSLQPFPTPAMLLIDVDGHDRADRAALAAVKPLAEMLQRFDISGNIGIDFPTIPDKAARKAVDAALAQALHGWSHERTAMNGFGFVQIVARMERPSLLALLAQDRPGAYARRLLRQAEHLDGPGATLLSAPPAVAEQLLPEWLSELEARTGRPARVKITGEAFDLAHCHAQVVAHEH